MEKNKKSLILGVLFAVTAAVGCTRNSTDDTTGRVETDQSRSEIQQPGATSSPGIGSGSSGSGGTAGDSGPGASGQ